MKITKRLFFNFLSVVILTGVLAALVFTYGHDKRQESVLQGELERKAKSIATTLAEHENLYSRLMGEESPKGGKGEGGGQKNEGGGQGSGQALTKILSDVAMNDVWVYKLEGNLGEIPEELQDLLKQTLEGKELVQRKDTALYFGQPILKEGVLLGAVLLKADMTPFTEELQRTERSLLYVLLFAVLIASLLAAYLSKSFLQPIGKMAKYSRTLAQGNYSELLDLKQKDELGELGNDLNFLALKLQEAKEDSEAEKAREKLFLSKIGHELRTPLTLLRSSMEAYREGRMEEQTEPEFFEKLYKEVRTLERLVEDLYLLAKLETPGFKMEKEELVFQDVLEDALHGLASRGRIHTHVVEEPLILFGDYGRLRQLLRNLLGNALQHGEGEVEVILHAPLLLQVKNKTSMKKEELEHLFTPFYQGSSSGGTGLGLTIAKEIAHAHGMELELRLEEGTFIAQLK